MTSEPRLPFIQDVCPQCRRALAVVHRIECDGHAFPVIWYCSEHGPVPPLRRAVAQDAFPDPVTPDWSAA